MRFEIAKELAGLSEEELKDYIKEKVARGRYEYGKDTTEKRDLIAWRLASQEALKRGITEKELANILVEGDKRGIGRTGRKEGV